MCRLSNACKQTQHGSVTLNVEVLPLEANAQLASMCADGAAEAAQKLCLRFSVADTGPGVPPSRRSAIFREWSGGPSGRVGRMHAGSGLGLPLCCALLEKMGSQLELTDPPHGSGAIFAFELSLRAVASTQLQPPMQPAPQVQPPTQPAAGETAIGPGGTALWPSTTGLRVLIADDAKLNRILLRNNLTKVLASEMSVEIVEVETGEAALELLLAPFAQPTPGSQACAGGGGFDIAFLDEIYGAGDNPLERLEGTEVTRRVRAHGVKGRRGGLLPIVGCTGNAGAGHTALALASGQNFVWGKPIPSQLEMRQQLAQVVPLRLDVGKATSVSGAPRE